VNGTRINGRPLPPASDQPLFFGSRIAIGSTVFSFSYAHDTTLPDLTGAEVDGRYVLETRLRDGAKAVLYAARDRRLPGRVAIKLLSPELAKYPEYLESFRREAELARQLHHPHVCRVLDYGHSGIERSGFRTITTHFLCLELMEGGNLADRIDRKEPLPTKQVAEWIDQVAGALAYAHRTGLVHGDLKPSAIVFDNDDHPYVTDFAVAQRASQDRQYVVGTPAFMAPELWEGRPPSPAVDQFALAALSYYMITGSRPFEGQDHPEIRRRNFAQGPLPAHQEADHHGRAGILRGVSSVLAMGLAARPQERYPSIADFAAALSAALVRPARSADAAQLFFSYQRESMAGWVNYFSDRVRAGGISVFVDTHNRDGSGVFPEQLARAIEDCHVFVCFVGDKTLESRWVRDEIGLAYQYGKPMVPVFQENYVKPPDDALTPGITRLLASQGVHLQDRRNLSPERSVADLMALCQRNIERNG
jgi:serine/threonine protein kinase